MRKLLLLFFCISMVSCVSVNKYNERIETPIVPDLLKKDIDYAYEQLQKLHPNLYWYIDKESLDYKFDSLKTTINQPLKPNEFYYKLAPVIADIKEGHLRLVPREKKLTRTEIKKLKNQRGLLSRYSYIIKNDRIYVSGNPDKIPNMEVGTEILEIHGIPTSELLKKYRKLVNSDGENQTFQKYILARRWPSYFSAEHGILDSVKMVTKYKKEVDSFYLKREIITPTIRKKEEAKERKLSNTERGKTKDYNPVTKSYNREIQFMSADQSIVYLKIKTFSGTHSKKFYRESFEQIRKSGTKYLILDIRENFGGSLAEIHNLYSYLVPHRFEFIKDIEVTSRTSMLKARYLSEFPTLLKPLAVLGYPFYVVGTLFLVKKENEQFYLRNNDLFTLKKPKKNFFNGEIYVLVNGGSFSAASILPAKLKYEKRAFLVGEETGGANDGTVAGRYAMKKLPESKLHLPIGLMLIQPSIKFTQTKKGVTPHVEIIPTTDDLLKKRDVQLGWVLQHIEKIEQMKKPQL